jgi:hypothetical protein
MANISTRNPGVKVVIRKNIGRKTVSGTAPVAEPYLGQRTQIDLTPMLSDEHAVRVSKTVHDPAGVFEIVISDQIDPDLLDSYYAAIEPMDTVEIRMAGNAYSYAKTQLPIMMRGFVTKVSRTQGMSVDGKPTRYVVITGHDYGKILHRYQIFMAPSIPPDAAAMITSFPFFTQNPSFPSQTIDAGLFVKACLDFVINPYLANMQGSGKSSGNGANDSAVSLMGYDIPVSGPVCSPFQIGQAFDGSLYTFMRDQCDVGPWFELFVEDRAAGPYLVYRPNPYWDALRGEPLLSANAVSGWAPPTPTKIDNQDVVSFTASRDDSNVANYFYLDSSPFVMGMGNFQQNSPDYNLKGLILDYGNLSPSLYGWSKMTARTNQGLAGLLQNQAGVSNADGQVMKNQGLAQQWMDLRRSQLIAQNQDNVIFENGAMTLKGNENIRAGGYVELSSGFLSSLCYCTSVTHAIQPFGSYLTDVQFERGTGFIDRLQTDDGMQSQYYAESLPTAQQLPVKAYPVTDPTISVSPIDAPSTPLPGGNKYNFKA